MFSADCRRKKGEIRLLEKQIRGEVIERCFQFIDLILHEIIYRENIYDSNLFVRRQMFRSIVHQCVDRHISSYIAQCVASLTHLFIHQFVQLVSVNILTNDRTSTILRRYLIEFHPIVDPCLRSIYDNTKQLIEQLDRMFSQCLNAIQQIKPLDNQNSSCRNKWTFQFRIYSDEKTNENLTIDEILREKLIYKEFILVNEQSKLLSKEKERIISTIKSFHCDRLDLQLMCEDDHYQQSNCRQQKFNDSSSSILNEQIKSESRLSSFTNFIDNNSTNISHFIYSPIYLFHDDQQEEEEDL